MLIFGLVLVVTILFVPDGLAGLMHRLRLRISGGRRATSGG
jgi:ABC-type branched-subunit amino acid transport system permease subunit